MSVQDSERYRKLQERLDTLPIGFPATKSGVELRILKALFTPKEAEIAVKMSFIPESVEKIYRRVKKIVASKDELSEIIKKTNKIAVMECICQKGKEHLNKPCKQTDMREYCFALNNSAQHVVDLNNGKFVTSDEALIIFKKAQEEGLILQPGNALDPNFICCCCGCCCDLITNIKKLDRPWELFHSNFIASVDSDLCVGCESCLNRCQMDAIEMVENIAAVNQKLCIGCGNCVVTCSEEAITLKKKEKELIPPNTTKDLFLKIMVKKAELRRKEKGVL